MRSPSAPTQPPSQPALTISHRAGSHRFSAGELRSLAVGLPGGGWACALVDLLAAAATPVEADLIEAAPVVGRPLLVPMHAALRSDSRVVLESTDVDVTLLEVPGWTEAAPCPVRRLVLRRFDELVGHDLADGAGRP